jgi:hypothetical protein
MKSVGLPTKRNPAHEQVVVDAVACQYCRARRTWRCTTPTGEPTVCHAVRYRAAFKAGVDLRTVPT